MCKFCEENRKLMTSIGDEDLSLILDEYEVEKTVAEKDLDEFLDKLRNVDII